MTNEELVKAIKDGDNRATETLFNQNQGIVHKAIKHFLGVAETEDLEQQAFIILLEAVKSYEEAQGTSFLTYYYRRLLWGFSRYLYQAENDKGLSPKALSLLTRYKTFERDYTATIGRAPTKKDAAFFLDLSGADQTLLEKALAIQNTVSLSVGTGEDGTATLEDMIPDSNNPYEEIDERLDRERDAETIRAAVKALPAEEARVISGKYFDDLTQSTVAEREEMTADKVRRLLFQGMRRLSYNEKLKRLAAERRLSSGAYRGGYDAFVSSGMSSTEKEAFRNMGISLHRDN